MLQVAGTNTALGVGAWIYSLVAMLHQVPGRFGICVVAMGVIYLADYHDRSSAGLWKQEILFVAAKRYIVLYPLSVSFAGLLAVYHDANQIIPVIPRFPTNRAVER